MAYDAVNSLVGQRHPDGQRYTYTYDEVGNRTLMADPTGRTTYSYTARNEMVTAAKPDDKTITYAYDALGRRQTMTDPDGGLFTYTYDAGSRLVEEVNPQNEITTIAYDVLGRMVDQRLGNGNLTTQVYDAAGRITGVANATSSGGIRSRFTYTYDRAGNRAGMTRRDHNDNLQRVTWTYDKTYQLTHEEATLDVSPGMLFRMFNATFTYDPVGNRLREQELIEFPVPSSGTTTYAYDAANELKTEETAGGVTTYSYDADGNRTLKASDSARTTYTWDANNRLIEAEPSGASPVTFIYNAAGKRLGKHTTAADQKFIYDGNRLLQQTNASDSTQKLYTSTDNDYGDLVSEHTPGGTSLYHLYDALGSTDRLLDENQTQQHEYLYRAFGEIFWQSGAVDTPFTFVGRQNYYYDPETGLYLLDARLYDPSTGQFISPDPMGYEGSQYNLYEYVKGKPTGLTDPKGLIPPCWNSRCPSIALPVSGYPAPRPGGRPIPGAPAPAPSPPPPPAPPQTPWWPPEGSPMWIIQEARRREGSWGPGDQSAHHCWAVCEAGRVGTPVGAVVGLFVTTIGEVIGEIFYPENDAIADHCANLRGAACGTAVSLHNSPVLIAGMSNGIEDTTLAMARSIVIPRPGPTPPTGPFRPGQFRGLGSCDECCGTRPMR